MLRHRGSKKVIDKVKELDAFPKIPDTYVEATPVGGTLSVFSFIFIICLIYSEVSYYIDSKLVFEFVPDTDIDEKLKLNIDLTVGMPCSALGADILDSTSQSVFAFGELQEEDTYWEMSEKERNRFKSLSEFNSHLREEYHAIADILWKSGQSLNSYVTPKAFKDPNKNFDACRFHGSLVLNKVAGNFHITAGKSLHLPQGHIHMNFMFDDTKQNFSHRINRLSFGDSTFGVINPLDGDEKITRDENMLYQYFIEVVPTDVDTALSHVKTFQYSVRDYGRPISHAKGSHGIPGIFIKYDIAALKLRVHQERENAVQFGLKLFSVIGGIYVIVGALNELIDKIRHFVLPKVDGKQKFEAPLVPGHSLLQDPPIIDLPAM